MATKDAVKGFDLAEVEQNETGIITLLHPTYGDEIGATVEVYGQDSEIYRKETRKAETKYTDYARRHGGKLMPPEEREALDRAKVIACTKEIKGLVYKGEPMTDPADTFARFPFIYEQIVAGIHNRANFIKGSSAN